MQIQTARVSFAVCLFAALAAAQGTLGLPSTPESGPASGRLARILPEFAGTELLAAERSQRVGPSELVGNGELVTDDATGTRYAVSSRRAGTSLAASSGLSQPGQWGPQDTDRPFGPYQLFQQVHGDFMARMDRYRPQAEFGIRYNPDQSLKRDPGHYNQYSTYANVAWRWNMWPDGYLMMGAYYEARRYEFSNMGRRGNGGDELNDETLHVAALNLGFGWFLDENLLLQVESRPGYYSDLDGTMHSQDFDMPSRALFTYRAADGLFLKLGVRYNQIFQDALWLPLIGFSWDFQGGNSGGRQLPGSVRLDVLLPEYVEASYWPTASTGFMVGTEIVGARYSVRAPVAQREAQFRDYVEIQEVVSYLGMLHRFDDVFSIRTRVGAVVAGDNYWTNGNSSFTPVRGMLSPGLWAEISFGFDF